MDNINVLEKYPNSVPCFINYEGKRYYFKLVEDEEHELVGNKLAKLCGIKTSHDMIILVNDRYYYLNYDLNNDGVYKDADAIGIEDLNMYNIWIMLEQTYPECAKKLMEQLIKIFIFDIFCFMMIDMC